MPHNENSKDEALRNKTEAIIAILKNCDNNPVARAAVLKVATSNH